MMGQTLEIKANIETRRSQNEFGALVWQYGEIWPTGGWGSIEYATPRPGQVAGGRWKPLQYIYAASLFQDVIVSCGASNQCYVRNDRPVDFNGTYEITAINVATGQAGPVAAKSLSLSSHSAYFFTLPTNAANATTTILQALVADVDGTLVSHNDILLTTPSALQLLPANVRAAVAAAPNPDNSVNVTVSADNVAAFVVLTTQAAGRFSDNAFTVVPPSYTVQFLPWGPLDFATLQSSLRVEDVSMYA
jgi:hypothetical protein